MCIYTLLRSIALLLPAGNLLWPAGWLFLLSGLAVDLKDRFAMSADLKAERDSMGSREGSQRWDKLLAMVRFALQCLALVLSGLDHRLGWSHQVPVCMQVAAFLIIMGGYTLRGWAQTHNRFFSSIVRVQTDRGHNVCSTGPYAWIRHPGYCGSIMIYLAMPIMLGGYWAICAVIPMVALWEARAVWEERLLKEKLQGYEEYMRRVRYRYVPGVW